MIWYGSGHGDITTYVHNSKDTTVKINVFNVEQLNQSFINHQIALKIKNINC